MILGSKRTSFLLNYMGLNLVSMILDDYSEVRSLYEKITSCILLLLFMCIVLFVACSQDATGSSTTGSGTSGSGILKRTVNLKDLPQYKANISKAVSLGVEKG